MTALVPCMYDQFKAAEIAQAVLPGSIDDQGLILNSIT